MTVTPNMFAAEADAVHFTEAYPAKEAAKALKIIGVKAVAVRGKGRGGKLVDSWRMDWVRA